MKEPQIIEPFPLQDVFSTGIAQIQVIGANARFLLYVDQPSLIGDEPERHIVAKIVIPMECLPEMIKQALCVTVGETAARVTDKLRGLAGLSRLH